MVRVEANAECISLCDEQGEIVYWDRAEWLEDADIVVPIANAIVLALTQGGQAVRDKLKGGA